MLRMDQCRNSSSISSKHYSCSFSKLFFKNISKKFHAILQIAFKLSHHLIIQHFFNNSCDQYSKNFCTDSAQCFSRNLFKNICCILSRDRLFFIILANYLGKVLKLPKESRSYFSEICLLRVTLKLTQVLQR